MQERVRQREQERWRLQRPQVRTALARVVVVLQVVEVPPLLVLLLAVQVVPLLVLAQAAVPLLRAWLASFWEKLVRIPRAA